MDERKPEEQRQPEEQLNRTHAAPGDSVTLGHERRDIRALDVLWFAGGMVIAAIVIHLAIWGFFNHLDRNATASDPEPNPLVKQDVADKSMLPQNRLRKLTRGFPEPRLQYDDIADLKALRRVENEKLGLDGENSYAWISQQDGIVRIPLARAMQLVAQRGLPGSAQGPPSVATSSISLPGGGGEIRPGQSTDIGKDSRQSIHDAAPQDHKPRP